jgi:hypothetical protein
MILLSLFLFVSGLLFTVLAWTALGACSSTSAGIRSTITLLLGIGGLYFSMGLALFMCIKCNKNCTAFETLMKGKDEFIFAALAILALIPSVVLLVMVSQNNDTDPLHVNSKGPCVCNNSRGSCIQTHAIAMVSLSTFMLGLSFIGFAASMYQKNKAMTMIAERVLSKG